MTKISKRFLTIIPVFVVFVLAGFVFFNFTNQQKNNSNLFLASISGGTEKADDNSTQSNSIVKGQPVLMADNNQKNIEDVEVGDEVISYNPETKINETDKVTEVLQGSHSEYLVFNNTLKTSLDHSIFANNNFIPAQDIKIGDLLLNSQGNNVAVFQIDHIYNEVETYDLTIEKNHNFFANGFLVHNVVQLQQSNWRVYYDDGAEPVTPFANENVAATLSNNSVIIRVRVNIVGGASPLTLTNLKIQYSTDNVNFTDMGSGNAWNWANGQGTDGGTVASLLISGTNTKLIYVESSNNSPAVGSSATSNEFDFAITPTATISTSTLYYFRFNKSTQEISLGSGKTHPQITTAAAAPAGATPTIGTGIKVLSGVKVQ